MKINNLQQYITLYNEERILFESIGPKIRERGYIQFEEFFKICMWKSRRPKQKYLKNKTIIETITKKCFIEKNESKKISLLCELEGVAIPTASAILTIVYPEKYAVIDVRCLDMLIDLGFKMKKSISSVNWLNYLKIMRSLAEENLVTPRQLDMALFAMHKEKLDKLDFKNLYTKLK